MVMVRLNDYTYNHKEGSRQVCDGTYNPFYAWHVNGRIDDWR